MTCGPGGRQSVSYTCGNASTTADDFLCTDRIPDNYRVCPASEVENCPGKLHYIVGRRLDKRLLLNFEVNRVSFSVVPNSKGEPTQK